MPGRAGRLLAAGRHLGQRHFDFRLKVAVGLGVRLQESPAARDAAGPGPTSRRRASTGHRSPAASNRECRPTATSAEASLSSENSLEIVRWARSTLRTSRLSAEFSSSSENSRTTASIFSPRALVISPLPADSSADQPGQGPFLVVERELAQDLIALGGQLRFDRFAQHGQASPCD